MMFSKSGSPRLWLVYGVLVGSLVSPLLAVAQAPNLTAEDKAAILLESGHRALNEQQFPQAVERYGEYLKTYGGNPDASAARYGLGVALLELPQRDLKGAIEVLAQPAGEAKFAERSYALYYLGLAYRGQGLEALAQAAAKPNEAAQHNNTARDQFTQALPRFAEAAAAFTARAKDGPMLEGKQLAADVDWALRARCDQAEMLLRLDKPQEARAITDGFAEKAALTKSRYRTTMLYFHGQACFLLKDYPSAGRVLSQLAPFDDPVHGLHAQYLLARTQHLLHERTEAQLLYDAVQTGYDKQKTALQQKLQNGENWKGQPEERARVEAFVRTPPDYVLRAILYSSVLLYEQQKYGDAQPRFNLLVKTYPQWPLAPEAQLRQGMCEVRLQQFQPAQATLQPLLGHPQLADRALLYSARAMIGLADPKQPQPYQQALQQACERLKQAADKANPLIAQEPEAKLRRSECQLELGDTQQLNKDFAGATATYAQMLQENHDPDRSEEVTQRLATAQHLAGKLDDSDQTCAKFVAQFPRSPLLAAILFRSAENAYARAGVGDPAKPVAPDAEAIKWYTEAIKRHALVVEKFPEFAQLPMSHFHIGVAQHRLGAYDKALAEFKAIDGPDRQGPLAAAAYYQADCTMRSMSLDATDAIAAGRQVKTLEELAGQLATFVGSDATHPLVPDATLKLGVCQTQLALLTADVNERNKALGEARQTYEKLLQQFANHPVAARATFERAKCQLAQNDVGGAINELARFKNDPFKNSEIAPLALLRLGSLLRAQNKADEAVAVLTQARQQYEGPLAADPVKSAWILMLQYQHGLAVKQTGKLEAARAIFEAAAKTFAARPESFECVWRVGQCRREETMQKLELARKTLARTDAKPEERTAALQQAQDAAKTLTEVATLLQTQAAALGEKVKESETQQRMLYEAAWCARTVGGIEVEVARKKLLDEATQKVKDELAKRFPAPAKAPQARVSEIPLASVPVQEGEKAAVKAYEAALAVKADSSVSLQCRYELAELYADRGSPEKAIALFQEVLEGEPTPDLEERTRLHLGAALLAKGDAKGALAQFTPLATNDKSPNFAEAKYRLAECFIADKNWPKAIEQLVPFRDQGPLQNLPNLSDRALLRLGYAYAQTQQWDPSRQACETLVNRFNQSVWRHEARFGMGWAWEQQKQFDQACNVYQQVANESAAEVGAKSLLHIGLARSEQKRWPEAVTALLAVADGYDYPALAAPALLQAARVKVEMQKPEEAIKHLQRVQRDYPDTEWAKEAAQRLATITVPVKQ